MRFRGNHQATKLFTLDLKIGCLKVERALTVQTLLKIPQSQRPSQRQIGRLRFQLKRDREFQKSKKLLHDFIPRELLEKGDLAVLNHSLLIFRRNSLTAKKRKIGNPITTNTVIANISCCINQHFNFWLVFVEDMSN